MRESEGEKYGEGSGYTERRNKERVLGGLHMVFGWENMDIFISRKARLRTDGPFAFIRYITYGGAVKAVEMMNGTRWGENKLLVSKSKPRQRDTIVKPQQGSARPPELKRRIVQKWVEKKKIQADPVMAPQRQVDQRKEI
ncbi:hypothetical protein PIB30_008302 [Stylosanthes scabra]|uniref:RRM domain-containing protein n=1 Tax=Stylosanthes scabra TaxID=79078 RepID=A0ABU6S4P2_9FABA|nr:hypothetical protein [Stylosanthes scabra]